MCMSPDQNVRRFKPETKEKDKLKAQGWNCLGIPPNWIGTQDIFELDKGGVFYRLFRVVSYPVFPSTGPDIIKWKRKTVDPKLFDEEWDEECLDRCSVIKCFRPGSMRIGNNRPVCKWHYYMPKKKGKRRGKRKSYKKLQNKINDSEDANRNAG